MENYMNSNALEQENNDLKTRVDELEKKSEEVEEWKGKYQAIAIQFNNLKANIRQLIDACQEPRPIPLDAGGEEVEVDAHDAGGGVITRSAAGRAEAGGDNI